MEIQDKQIDWQRHFLKNKVAVSYRTRSRKYVKFLPIRLEKSMQYIITRKSFLHSLWIIFIFIPCMTATNNIQAARYNPVTRELFLSSLENGSKTWTDVTIKLNSNGTYEMQSGTESPLPFRCSGLFNQATLDILTPKSKQTDPEKINSVIGCRWIKQTNSVSTSITIPGASSNIPGISSVNYVWLDKNCSSLNVSFTDGTEGATGLSIGIKNGSCSTDANHDAPYDLKSKLFLVGSVEVNDNITATEVLIKFHAGNKYELISVPLGSLGNPTPPLICKLLKKSDFDVVSTAMSPEEINNLLGCQWHVKTLSSFNMNDTVEYGWSDHECNSISIVTSELEFFSNSKRFHQNFSSGCGTLSAH